MSAHTPGPWKWHWKLDGLKADCGVFSEKTEGHAYSICRAPVFEAQDQWEANARLISAAPDMLEALEALVQADASGELDDSMFAAARAAIAKAKGKT